MPTYDLRFTTTRAEDKQAYDLKIPFETRLSGQSGCPDRCKACAQAILDDIDDDEWYCPHDVWTMVAKLTAASEEEACAMLTQYWPKHKLLWCDEVEPDFQGRFGFAPTTEVAGPPK